MKSLKQSYNFRSYDALISFLLISLASNDYPIATPEVVMESSVPIILTGIPGSGKTTFLRNLTTSLDGPVFVFDVHDEYSNLAKINLGEFFSIDFKIEKRKLRLVPSSNVDVSKSEADSIFRHLIMFQKQLSNWVIVVEEGHRFTDTPFLKSLLAEARKHMRKMILVSHQVEPYNGLSIILKASKQIV
jgi:dephospho-CoA kinase